MTAIATLVMRCFSGSYQARVKILLGMNKWQRRVGGSDCVNLLVAQFCSDRTHVGLGPARIAHTIGRVGAGTFFVAIDIQRIGMHKLGQTGNRRHVTPLADTLITMAVVALVH